MKLFDGGYNLNFYEIFDVFFGGSVFLFWELGFLDLEILKL